MSNPKLEETFEEWYCGYCGSAEKKNTIKNKKAGYYVMSCNQCGVVIRFYVLSSPTRTKEEAEEVFNNTPLTDSQRYGGTTRGKKRRKKRTKKKTVGDPYTR